MTDTAAKPADDKPKVLEGTLTVDDKFTFASQRLTYNSAQTIAAKVAKQIAGAMDSRKTVILVSVAVLADIANLHATHLVIDDITADYRAVSDHAGSSPSVKAALAGAPATAKFALTGATVPFLAPVVGTLDAALGVISLFRENVEYHGTATQVDALAFALAVAGQLKKDAADKVFLPELMVMRNAASDENSLRKRVFQLERAKAEAWQTIQPMLKILVEKEKELEAANQNKDAARAAVLNQEVQSLRGELDPIASAVSRADQRVAELQAGWKQTDEFGVSVLARQLRAETLLAMGETVLVHAAIVSSGGFNRTSRTLWQSMFGGDGLSSTGGAIARWALLDKDGSIKIAGILSEQESSAPVPDQSW